MSFLDKLSALLPFSKKDEVLEYFFALNISAEELTAALWTIEGNKLQILETASENYSSLDDIAHVTDKLLDAVLGIRNIEPQKILFGVPSSWLSDEDLKEEYLKRLRVLVKELELIPMAYVETAHALVHFLEKIEGVPPTAILAGIEEHHLTVSVVRAGKLDGVKIVSRGDSTGADIEKALLTFTSVETLPSKVLIYNYQKEDWEKLKGQLLDFPWMSKLSFLHFPKIDTLQENMEIKSISLAGASEINKDVLYTGQTIPQAVKKPVLISDEVLEEEGEQTGSKEDSVNKEEVPEKQNESEETETSESVQNDNLGFVVGDVSIKSPVEESTELAAADKDENGSLMEDKELVVSEETKMVGAEDFTPTIPEGNLSSKELSFRSFLTTLKTKFSFKNTKSMALMLTVFGVLLVLLGAYLFLLKAEIKIFVEPKILEKDSQVTADPRQKEVNEDAKIIPGQIVQTEVSGSGKDSSSGKKQIGDPAKGTVVIYNKTNDSVTLSKGTVLTGPNSTKFTLDLSVNIASSSARSDGISFGKHNATITASSVGADGNIPSDSDLSVVGYSVNQVAAKAEGNFSGGTSKDVTVVSDADQKRLLAQVSSDLRRQAQQKLQESNIEKKILQEALLEEIVKRSFNKNINDQATEFSLNLTVKFRGTAFEDKDLKLIVSKLVTTDVPEGFELNLEDTETQADVSKLEKDGKLIFLARFKAKLLPKINTDEVKNKIKGKSAKQAAEILKGIENVLGSEIKTIPALPAFLQRIPLLSQNIKIEVGLK